MPINSFLYPAKNVPVVYDVANSLRFNDGSSDYLEKNFSSTQDSRRIFTVSAWVKRGNLTGGDQRYWGSSEGSGEGYNSLGFDGSDKLKVLSGNTSNSGTQLNFTSNQVFRDVSAWSHIVYAVDTTQSTESNRVKIYHNGSQITSWSTATYPSQNTDLLTSTTPQMTIGMRDLRGTNANFFDGYLAEMVFIDNQQLDATSFGEFDEDSPNIWKPKSVSGLTFGTNGFYLDFENASSLGADVSGNSNNFTVNNLTSVDQSTDTCTNNFATFNILLGNNRQGSQLTFSEANLKVQDSGGSNDPYIPSTIGVTKGKWYAELKLDAYSEDGHAFGIAATNGDFSESIDNQFCILQYATKGADNLPRIYNFGDLSDNNLSDSDPGDIIGCAVDIDNGTVNFTVNGSAYGSQVTGLTSNFSGKTIFFIIRGEGGGSRTFTSSVNFGSPSFSISSGNSDANGYGNFEYSVPSGYYALNTKNLAEFG